MEKKTKAKSICIDFDGTIAKYEGFKGKGIFGDPIPGTKEATEQLRSAGYKIIIHTTRSETGSISEYLNKHNIIYDYINFNPDNFELQLSPHKPVADLYIDDRAIKFEGNWKDTMQQITDYKEWWRK